MRGQIPDSLIAERLPSISTKGRLRQEIKCQSDSVAGAVSQRACVYCGARVVLNPITDALHLVHGPIGCAAYTWDIRGSLSSGEDLYRYSFSTDLKEKDIIFGGEKKLAQAIDELVAKYQPPLLLVYSTCIVGVIGDDLEAVCRQASDKHGIEIVPVQSSGFAGTKKEGYQAACDVLLRLMEPSSTEKREGINYLGDFNLAGEVWIIKRYLQQMKIKVNTVFTGDSNYQSLLKAPRAALNIIQCAGSMNYLAQQMEDKYGIPQLHISFLGMEDTARSLREIALALGEMEALERAEAIIERETRRCQPQIDFYRSRLEGKKAAIYVGGGFKAISLVKQFREIGIDVVMIGTQTGRPEEYRTIDELVDEGTVILDDANPSELEKFMLEQDADILVGGVKERPLAYKLGKAFVDHNHDRKHPLSGFEGAVNFAREVCATVCSPVWRFVS